MINNNIEENYCSYEISKLLKDLGFKVPVQSCYDGSQCIASYGKVFELKNYNVGGGTTTSRPSCYIALEWIRKNYQIYITSSLTYCYLDINNNMVKENESGWIKVTNNITPTFYYKISNYNEPEKIIRQQSYFNSLNEAEEAALLYTLTNLIKS